MLPKRAQGQLRPSEDRTPPLRPTYAHVHSDALRHNLRAVRAEVGERCRILAVVKADGYGHGAVVAARAFAEAGAWGLAVSLVEEGVELREAGITAPVLVLGGVHPGSVDILVRRQLTPVVWSLEHLELLRGAVSQGGRDRVPIHLKLDTGMSRLGLLPRDLPATLDWLVKDGGRSVSLEGLMTHLACADDADDELTNARQLARFKDCREVVTQRGLLPELCHVCNSAGIARLPSAHFDMVRPGIALYGAASSREVELADLQLAMGVHSRLLGIRELPAGVRVSYGGRERLDRDSKLGIVPVGYGDGYARSMSGRAEMLVHGQRCRVVGNITMDVCMVDVTDIPNVEAGAPVTLLGHQDPGRIDVYELADWAGVIPYEVLCGISKRVPRR